MSGGLSPVTVTPGRYESTDYMIRDPQSVGQVVIINIDQFDEPEEYPDRKGSANDVNRLTATLKMYGFNKIHLVQSKERLTKASLTEQLKDIAQSPECTQDADVFMCIILSYGGDGYFNDYEGTRVYLNDIQEIFKGLNCPGLVLKPKLFIMQVCDVAISKAAYQPAEYGVKKGMRMMGIVTHPSDADFLSYTSTVSGALNWATDENKCSEFVQSLCSCMEENEKIDFGKLSFQVNQKMDAYINDFKNYSLKLPLCESQLIKPLILAKNVT